MSCVLIHSAVIVEHFLHDRSAVESCASVSFSFVFGDYPETARQKDSVI